VATLLDLISRIVARTSLLALVLAITAVEPCAAQAPNPLAQTPKSQTSTQPGASLTFLRIHIIDIDPKPLIAGQDGVVTFYADITSSDPTDAILKEWNEWVQGVMVVLDDHGARMGIRSSYGLKPSGAAVNATGGVAAPVAYEASAAVSFSVDRGLLARSLFGLRLASGHILFLANGAGMTSNLLSVQIEDSLERRLVLFAVIGALSLTFLVGSIFLLRLTETGRAAFDGLGHSIRALFKPSAATTVAKTSGITPPYDRPDEPAKSRTIPPPHIPDDLVDALNAGKAMLALGSGASAQAGFPTGQALIDTLLQQVSNRPTPSILSTLTEAAQSDGTVFRVGGFGQIMKVLLSEVKRDEVTSEIARQLSEIRPAPAFHRSLAALPWHGLLSLTWDSFADEIFTSSRSPRKWQRFGLDATRDLAAALRTDNRIILRPFGDLDRPTSLSLSIDEFRRNLSRAPEFQRALGLLLQTQNFLFLGVGADTLEQFLQAVAPELEIGPLRHSALMPHNPINEVFSSTLTRFGVRLIPYDPRDGHEAVVTFVSSLAEECRRRDRANSISSIKKAKAKPSESRITQLKLTNIGLFDTLELNFAEGPIKETGKLPWTVIFGANGCGKSSILKAIALVLAGKDPNAVGAAQRLLKTGKPDGSIELRLLGAPPLRTLLNRDRREVMVKSVQVTPVEAGAALVLGFPALRGAPSKNPVGPANLESHDPEPADILPLLNGAVDGRLESFKQWIVNVLEQAGRGDTRAIAKRKLIDEIIRDLVPGHVNALASLDSSYIIRVETPEGNVPFDDLSQGMASIFNWVGVLAQRLYEIYPDEERPEDRPAIVLIDEIDAHLHPEWQRKIVELTKKCFPKIQIIASSHSSLLAGALRAQELCVLQRDPETNRVGAVAGKIDTFGQRSDDILTSAIFGLHTDRNPETERLIHRYFDLFEKREKDDQEKRQLAELEQALKKLRYGEVSPNDQGPQTWTPEQIETLRRHFAAAPESNDPKRSELL
jgi:AAA domain, putative AbiEii toxin, Type IV TA system/AAA domain